MPIFVLVLSIKSAGKVEITCAISGENDRWQGRTRIFPSLMEAEEALREARVLPMVGPDQRLNAARSEISPSFFVESEPAIQMQLLYRNDPQKRSVRTFVRFQDRRGGVAHLTGEYWLSGELTVGSVLTVQTPLGDRAVAIQAITRSEDVKFGSDETRRETDVEIEL